MTYALITTHVDDAKSRLPSQYQKPKMLAKIQALVQSVQALEYAIQDMFQGRLLSHATGEQLDGIGQIVGIERDGLDDGIYRLLIFGKIAENNSDTSVPTLSSIIMQIFQADSVWVKTPGSPGRSQNKGYAYVAFGVGSPKTDLSLLPTLLSIVHGAIGQGIDLSYINTYDASGTFAFAGAQPWVKGFGTGTFSKTIYSNGAK